MTIEGLLRSHSMNKTVVRMLRENRKNIEIIIIYCIEKEIVRAMRQHSVHIENI